MSSVVAGRVSRFGFATAISIAQTMIGRWIEPHVFITWVQEIRGKCR